MSFFLYELLKRRHNEEKDPRFTDLQRKYASSESLCLLSYDLDEYNHAIKLENTFKILNENGCLEEYRVVPIQLCQGGLKPYILLPVDKTNKEVKVVFRGTADSASLWRDIEPGSPGTVSFDKNKETIFNQLMKTTLDYFQDIQDIRLTTAGHSLGGSDAENFANYCCEKWAQEKSMGPFHELTVYALNSPGITHKATTQGIQAVTQLKTLYPHFMPNVFFGKTEHDPVQTLGQNHFLNGIDSSLANINLIKLKKKFVSSNTEIQYLLDVKDTLATLTKQLAHYVKRSVNAHKLNTYFTPDENGILSNRAESYKVLSNQSPEQREELHSDLAYKAHSVLYIHQNLAKLLNYTSWARSENNTCSIEEVTAQTATMKLQ